MLNLPSFITSSIHAHAHICQRLIFWVFVAGEFDRQTTVLLYRLLLLLLYPQHDFVNRALSGLLMVPLIRVLEAPPPKPKSSINDETELEEEEGDDTKQVRYMYMYITTSIHVHVYACTCTKYMYMCTVHHYFNTCTLLHVHVYDCTCTKYMCTVHHYFNTCTILHVLGMGNILIIVIIVIKISCDNHIV